MIFYLNLKSRVGDSPDSDLVVSVSSKEGLTISRPSKGDWLWGNVASTNVLQGNLQFIDNSLGFKIPNLDTSSSSSNQPVTVWREDESVDDITSFKRVEVLVFVQVPKHGDTVLSTRSTKGTIWRNSDSRNVTSVTVVVGLQFALGNIPNLNKLLAFGLKRWNSVLTKQQIANGQLFLWKTSLFPSLAEIHQPIKDLEISSCSFLHEKYRASWFWKTQRSICALHIFPRSLSIAKWSIQGDFYQHTLTSLSQPEETKIGLAEFGENLTVETHSEWPSSVRVNLHSPRVFHNLIDLSREEETIWRLSGEKQTERTSLVCPTKRRVVFPVAISQRRRVLSRIVRICSIIKFDNQWAHFIRIQWIRLDQYFCNQKTVLVDR